MDVSLSVNYTSPPSLDGFHVISYLCTIFLGTKLRAKYEGVDKQVHCQQGVSETTLIPKICVGMTNKKENPCSLEQEMAEKAEVLASQCSVREEQLVNLTLDRIVAEVVSKETDIVNLMTASKGPCLNSVRETVIREVIRSADGQLWCPSYDERSRSKQRVNVYTGTHWEAVETQLLLDFTAHCAERIGVPESLRMNPVFMKSLSEALAFNLAKDRHQLIPKGEAWLNMRNGTLVIRKVGTVSLHEHSKEDLFFYTLPYAYDPDAKCEMWHNFLNRVLPDMDAQQLLREYIGYILMTDHSLEKTLMLYGSGLNGKSVTLEVIEGLLGSQNVSYLSLADLTNDDVKRAAFEHKMINISHESGKDVNPNVLKQLISGERVVIRHLYHDPRETSEYGKLIASFNIMPRAENIFGFFRRLLILPYKVTITKEEIDRQLASKLMKELPGILNWVLEALPNLMSRGEFSHCESCEKALEMYRLQSDSVRLFLNEMCESSENTTHGQELFTAYKNYCFDSQLKPIGKNKFYARLEELGYETVMYNETKYFKLKVLHQ